MIMLVEIELKKNIIVKLLDLKDDKDRIPEIDILVEDNQIWKKDNFEAKIYHIPGHTIWTYCFSFF